MTTRWLACCASLLLLCACVQRRLRITSEPAGVEVAVDGVRAGPTPVTLPYTHAGTRRIDLWIPSRRDPEQLHLRRTEYVTLTERWYERFPFDLVSELLLPVPRVDERVFHFVLEPRRDEAPPEDLLPRAERLRASAR